MTGIFWIFIMVICFFALLIIANLLFHYNKYIEKKKYNKTTELIENYKKRKANGKQ